MIRECRDLRPAAGSWCLDFGVVSGCPPLGLFGGNDDRELDADVSCCAEGDREQELLRENPLALLAKMMGARVPGESAFVSAEEFGAKFSEMD